MMKPRATRSPLARRSDTGWIPGMKAPCAAAAVALAMSLWSGQIAQAAGLQFAPHRAVYDVELERAQSGSSIAGLKGRMVFEFAGNACDGYTQNMRLVTKVTDRDGRPSISDLRTSSWEARDHRQFRFTSSTYRNQQLSESTAGDAERRDRNGAIVVKLRKPVDTTIKVPQQALFPVEHSLRLLQAAQAGERTLAAPLYDGSEKGDKYYETTTVIGTQYPLGGDAAIEGVENAAILGSVPSWPMAVSYYEPSEAKNEGLPSYEMAFRYYANGVTSSLTIDYGDFSLRGNLAQIEFLEAGACVPD